LHALFEIAAAGEALVGIKNIHWLTSLSLLAMGHQLFPFRKTALSLQPFLHLRSLVL